MSNCVLSAPQTRGTIVAAPSIGTTISEAYSEGLDRIGPWAAPVAVVAGVAGLIAGAIAQLQVALVPDAEEVFNAVLSGDGLSSTDFRTIQLLSALSMLISFVISVGATATFAGRFHRERHGAAPDVPAPGAVLPELLAQFMALMPRIGMVIGLVVLGQFIAAFSETLGGLIAIVGAIVALWFGIRWIYAAVISGSGEATGDAAFDRSAEVVDGSWWATFGSWIVIGLATGLPIAVIAWIVGGILPGAFLSAFGNQFVATFGLATISAAAFASAWSQLEGGDSHPAVEAPPAAQELPPTDEQPPADPGTTGPFS